MAAKCATCGASRNHSVHLRAVAPAGQFHPYADASKAGLRAVSEGRQAYVKSQAHLDAYEAASGSQCLAGLAGAPGACVLPLTPHHTVPRSKAGGLEAADTFPIITLCSFHNGWVQEDGREWATTHYVTVGNRDWPFLVSDEWLQAEREGLRI